MEHMLSQRFRLGASIGRPRGVSSEIANNPAASFDSRDDESGAGHTAINLMKNSGSDNKHKAVIMLPSTDKPQQTSTDKLGMSKQHMDIKRTISQDTAETAVMSVHSVGTHVSNGTEASDATLDAAIDASNQNGTSLQVLELPTIDENEQDADMTQDSVIGEKILASAHNTPGAKSNMAVIAEPEPSATNNNNASVDADTDARTSFPDFMTSMPQTWSGSSLSFIKFLLFVKESDEAFIPEMDKMLADYDMLIHSLQTENKDLKNKLKTEIGALKKRIHDKKKLVTKLTKKLTECQGYITELTTELERIYLEKGVEGGVQDRLQVSRPDDLTVATATSEITMEQSLHVPSGTVESTLSRMLAEERSKAETLLELNQSLNDDLSDSRREIEELESKLTESEKTKSDLEKTMENNWYKARALMLENQTLQEDLAGVVIELSDAQEEFSEREAQLIHMIESSGSSEDEEDCMSIEGDQHNVHDLEANIALLQEELEVSKRVMGAMKSREAESTHRAGELLIQNENLKARSEAVKSVHKQKFQVLSQELLQIKAENENMRKKLQDNDGMVRFAHQIISSQNGDGASGSSKDQRIAALEQKVASLQQEQTHKSDRVAKTLRDTLVFLYDCAAGSTGQDPSALIQNVRETSAIFLNGSS